MERVAIEDFFEDIIGKAQRGLGLDAATLCQDAGISETALAALKNGEFDESAARAVAPPLGLDPDALVISGQKGWYPETPAVEGLAMFNTPYHDMAVNAFLVWDPATRAAAAFDTGTDAALLLDHVVEHDLKLEKIFLTHTHGDHIADLDHLLSAHSSVPVYLGALEADAVDDVNPINGGDAFEVGGLKIRAALTTGHSKGGITYVIEGLSVPVAIVGDALFAGSMGGGMVSFTDALRTNRQEIFTLPDSTVICPGHGPTSTIGQEKAHNPFYPEFK